MVDQFGSYRSRMHPKTRRLTPFPEGCSRRRSVPCGEAPASTSAIGSTGAATVISTARGTGSPSPRAASRAGACLPVARAGRGQEPPRGAPLPQTAAGSDRLHHAQERALIDTGRRWQRWAVLALERACHPRVTRRIVPQCRMTRMALLQAASRRARFGAGSQSGAGRRCGNHDAEPVFEADCRSSSAFESAAALVPPQRSRVDRAIRERLPPSCDLVGSIRAPSIVVT